ncbi:hypothetical protein ACGFJC_49820 [Nonomuraea fuscirosea]|uniref:hypothetical protein n=1 Tax=Nonomuraea fuscirosea TaxID=1291556 RepID=UPI003441B232
MIVLLRLSYLTVTTLHRLPMDGLRHPALLVHPDTVLRRHRDLLRRRHAAASAPGGRGRSRTVRSIRLLVLRPARENASWGYRRIHGELAALGIKVAASTVWEILKAHGIDSAPERTAKSLIRNRHAKFTAAFDAELADAGVRIVKSGGPDTTDELHHGALDPDLPARTAGPDGDLDQHGLLHLQGRDLEG